MYNLILLFVLSPYTAIIALLYAAYKLYKNRDEIQKNTWNIGLLILFMWSFMVGVINRSLMSVVVSLIFLLYFSMSVYIENQWSSEEQICKLSHYLLKFSIFSGVLGIVEKIAFENYPMLLWRKILGLPATATSAHRIYSTFGNPNIAGDWFAIMIVIALFYEGRSKNKKEKSFYYGCVSLFLVNLFLTGSRGAFVAMACGLAVLFMFKCSKHNRMIFSGIILVVVIIGFMPDKVPNISEDIVGHNIDRSVSLREEIWRGSLMMSKEKPLTGWGLMGTIEYGKPYFKYSGVVNHSHNIWLSLLTSLGVVGLSIYLFMRVYVYKNMVKLLSKENKNSSCVQLLIAIQAVIISHGIVDFTIIAPQIGMLFIGTSSMIIALAKESISIKGSTKRVAYLNFNNKA